MCLALMKGRHDHVPSDHISEHLALAGCVGVVREDGGDFLVLVVTTWVVVGA